MPLHDEGELWLLRVALQGEANTADLYWGLHTSSTALLEADDLTDVPEVAGAVGYARIATERSAVGWPDVVTNGSGLGQATSKLLAFGPPTGSWGTVRGAFLTDVSSGTSGLLIASYQLVSPVTRDTPDPALYIRPVVTST